MTPIAWVAEEHPAEWFWHELPDRTRDYQVHVIGANWSVDHPQSWRGYGFSTILSSNGDVLASAHSLHGSEIVLARLPVGSQDGSR